MVHPKNSTFFLLTDKKKPLTGISGFFVKK
jgi:hypothetical protein